jgi:hypothetical protein
LLTERPAALSNQDVAQKKLASRCILTLAKAAEQK